MFAGGIKFEELYEKLEKIGTGAYGVVYKAKNVQTGQFVAIKKTKLDMPNEGIPATTLREVALLREFNHHNIVRLTDVSISKNRLFLVFEYMNNDLRSFLDQLEPHAYLPYTIIKSILQGILKGMFICHSRKILHRDMKPQNILLDSSNTPKICDFGLARTFQYERNQFTQQVVTLWYRAPELLLGQREYTTSIDIWSIGCIFAELITKRPLFAGDSELDQQFKIFKLLGTPTDETWPGVEKLPNYRDTYPQWPSTNLDKLFADYPIDRNGVDLLKKMIEIDPSKRISVSNALDHPYFKN